MTPPVNPFPTVFELHSSHVEDDVDTDLKPPVNPIKIKKLKDTTTQTEPTTTDNRFNFSPTTKTPTSTKKKNTIKTTTRPSHQGGNR